MISSTSATEMMAAAAPKGKISRVVVSVSGCWYEKEGIYNFDPAFQRSGRL